MLGVENSFKHGPENKSFIRLNKLLTNLLGSTFVFVTWIRKLYDRRFRNHRKTWNIGIASDISIPANDTEKLQMIITKFEENIEEYETKIKVEKTKLMI